jgi:5-methylcytosine-specific restriction endonuclease McrA
MDEEMLRRLIREEIARALGRRPNDLSPEALAQRKAAASGRREAALKRWRAEGIGDVIGDDNADRRRFLRMQRARELGTHTELEWQAMLKLFGGICLKCGSNGLKLLKDHVVPVYENGASDDIWNLQPLCKRCNTGKMVGRHDYREQRRPGWAEGLRCLLEAVEVSNGTAYATPSAIPSAKRGTKNRRQINREQHEADVAHTAQVCNSVSIDDKLCTGSSDEPVSLAPLTAGAKVWLAYSAAYKLRYGVFPVRNAKANAMLKSFVGRVPMAEAPDVAEFYVKSDEAIYAKSAHCVDLLLRDAEKVRMAWATGRRVNGHDSAGKAWWEMWAGIEAMGKELGVAPDENPQVFKGRVLRAAIDAGKLPDEVKHKLGMA